MKEYIERDALIEEEQEICYWNGTNDVYGYFVSSEIIKSMPVTDVAPVVHGAWSLESDEEMPNFMFKLVVCSACGEKANHTYNYCPNCGAKMDGGK